MSGCAYYPQAVDIPLISEKNDLRIDAGISSAVEAHATVSYGLTDKLAVQAFGRYGNDPDEFYLQAATGLYKQYVNGWITEYYGGLGAGKNFHIRRKSGGPSATGNYEMLFLQMNAGKRDIKFANLDFGLSLKTGLLNAHVFDHGYWIDKYYEPGNSYNDLHLVIEPTAVIRLGGKRLKFNIKGGLSYVPFNHKADFKLPYGWWNIGIGLNYHF